MAMALTRSKGTQFRPGHPERHRRGGVSSHESCERYALKLGTFGRRRLRLCRDGTGTAMLHRGGQCRAGTPWSVGPVLMAPAP